MPHKFNAGRRDKYPKAKYAVTNWSDYNEAHRRPGDVTIWLEDGAAGKRFAPKRKGRGGQARQLVEPQEPRRGTSPPRGDQIETLRATSPFGDLLFGIARACRV